MGGAGILSVMSGRTIILGHPIGFTARKEETDKAILPRADGIERGCCRGTVRQIHRETGGPFSLMMNGAAHGVDAILEVGFPFIITLDDEADLLEETRFLFRQLIKASRFHLQVLVELAQDAQNFERVIEKTFQGLSELAIFLVKGGLLELESSGGVTMLRGEKQMQLFRGHSGGQASSDFHRAGSAETEDGKFGSR